MSNLYLYLPHKSFVDNLPSLFFNLLCNNYYNESMNSITYTIYYKILHTLNSNISLDKHITNSEFKIHINKHIYNLLNTNINSYIDVLIKDKKFMNELFTNNEFQYYTNQSNEILRLLSDNNTNFSETFNISKNYNLYKTQYLNNKKSLKQNEIREKTIYTLKQKIYEIFIVIDGLEKIMYNNYNNLLEYQTKKFDEMLTLIKNLYGTSHLNYCNINHIYFMYTNKTIDYYDIYYDILTYPELKDKIVIMFIQLNYLKYNEKIKKLVNFKQYKNIVANIFKKFLYEKEQDDDYEIVNLSSAQKQLILQKSTKLLSTLKSKLLHNFKSKYPTDISSYNYNDIYNNSLTIPLKPIPIEVINNINISQFKENTPKESENIISNKDIINEIIPDINKQQQQHTILKKNKSNIIITEAENRLNLVKQNKEDVDYMNHTLTFFTENFEDDENLTKLKEAISFLNIEFINHFNINILKVKNHNQNNSKLLSNIINDINDEYSIDSHKQNSSVYIIDDYHTLSPIYETNFDIKIDGVKYKFKTLLHYIYYNQYLELYKIYYKYSNHTELNIISIHTLSYNLIFKTSQLNIFESNKSIISNKTNFKNFSELQNTFYELLNNIKYFLFKLEINTKINNPQIPYFNFILSYTSNMNIIYSDKDDNYLGIGKYGNGENMIGLFLNEYKKYIIRSNNIFDYTYKDIFLIMCDFNSNVFNWFNLKLNNILHTLINCCMLSNNFNIDIIFINNIISSIYTDYKSHNIYYLPIHKSFNTYITQELTTLNESYSNTNILISDKAIIEIWKLCHNFIYNLFNFQQDIIENSDDFQTFINYYDKHNIEHLLYYTLSINNFKTYEEGIQNYVETTTKKLQTFFRSDNDYQKYCINILFSNNIDHDNFSSLIRTYNNSLSFNVNGETKYINIINSKLSIPQ